MEDRDVDTGTYVVMSIFLALAVVIYLAVVLKKIVISFHM